MSLPVSARSRCVICGASPTQMNHLGGRKFLASFEMPFCIPHHKTFHVLVTQAGIDLSYTSDPVDRVRRALAAIKIGEWMLLEQLKQEIQRTEKSNNEQSKTNRAA